MKLSLRELFLLIALVEMGLGWSLHVRQMQTEARSLQRDLLMQADYVSQFVSVLKQLGCEIPPDSDSRCAGAVHQDLCFASSSERNTLCLVHAVWPAERAATDVG